MENEKNKTLVAGQPTGDTTESGNFRHNSDGTFASGNYKIDDKPEAKIPKDFVWDDSEWEKVKDLDVENLKRKTSIKNVEKMSDQELLQEIKIHTEFIKNNGFDLSKFQTAFNGDLKLKCANFRQLERIMKKYPIGLNKCELVNSNHYKDESGGWAYMKTHLEYDDNDYSLKIINGNYCKPIIAEINVRMNFNAKKFMSYESCKSEIKSIINEGWWIDVDDENLVTQTITHEYAHGLHNKMFKDYCDSIGKKNFYYGGKGKSKVDEFKKMLIEFVENIRKETYEEFIKDSSNEYIDYYKFKNICSEYGRKNNVKEWFAETFASLECGKPNKAAIALGKVLKNKGYMKGE